MRLPIPLSDVQYEQQLNRLILRWQDHQHSYSDNSRIPLILDALGSSSVPLSRADVMIAIGMGKGSVEERYRMSSKIRMLINQGKVEIAGERRVYNTLAPLYRLSGQGNKHEIANSNWFLREVDKLDARRAFTDCQTSRIATHAAVLQSDRDKAIIVRRLAGEELQSIGDSFGITRERIRQIYECAVSGRNPRGSVPRALRGKQI